MGDVQSTRDPVQPLGIKGQDMIDGILLFLECAGIRRHADRRETKKPSTAGATALPLPPPHPSDSPRREARGETYEGLPANR
jgi:hypothetical protein